MIDLVWLLDLELGGRTIRASSRPIVVDGEAYPGTLDRVELRETLEGVGSLPSEREAVVTLAAPYLVTPYAVIQGRATLRLWSGVGRGRVELQGQCRATEIGGASEQIGITITADAYADRGSTHDPLAQVTAQTWPGAREDAFGSWYPRMYGAVGWDVWKGAFRDVGANFRLLPVTVDPSPGAGGRANKLLITDAINHDKPTEIAISSIQPGGDTSLGLTVTAAGIATETDGLGMPVYTIDISGQSAAFRRGDVFWARVNDTDRMGRRRVLPGGVATVGDLLLSLASEADVAVDIGEWVRFAETVPYRVSSVVREPTPPLTAASDILELLPCGLYSSPRGLAVVRWPYDARRGDAVARLVEGVTCSRRSGVRLMRRPDEVVGLYTVEYAYSETQDRYLSTASIIADPYAVVDPDRGQTTDVWIRSSDEGEAYQRIEAPWLADDAGAFELLTWASRRQSLGAREVDLDVDAQIAQALALGSVVLVEVPSLGLTDAIGIVAGRTLSDSSAWPMRIVLLSPVGLDRQSPPTGRISVAPPVVRDPSQS